MNGSSRHLPADPANETAMYCRKCGYELRGLTAARCPECGRPFDRNNPRTYRLRRVSRWAALPRWIALRLSLLLLALGLPWGWFYIGWRSEQNARATLDPAVTVSYEPLVSSRLRTCMGPAGFVLDRVDSVVITTDDRDMRVLAEFHHLRLLLICQAPVTDLSPLKRLHKLETITLWSTDVTDIRPLAGLKDLQSLDLIGSPVTDLSPLAGLTSLRELSLVKRTTPDTQIQLLRRALPKCAIMLE
jgi:hypothetical protein